MTLFLGRFASGQCTLYVTETDTLELPGKVRKAIGKVHGEMFRDSAECISKASGLRALMMDQGFLAASIDQVNGTGDSLTIVLSAGERYRWAKLDPGNADEGLLSSAGFRDKFYDDRTISLRGTSSLNQRLLRYCENNGYPFAQVSYKDVEVDGGQIRATLDLQPGVYYTYDTLSVKGSARLSRKYLKSYLSIKEGDPYDEAQIRKIPNRLRELPMVSETRPFAVAFTEENSRVILYLEDKKASQVDGIIGILPDNETAGKVQLTGELRLRLLSSFGRGELFDLNWRQPQAETQDLKIRANYPFIFATPLGVDFNLGIYKKDSTFLDVILGGGLQLLMKGGNYFQVFVENRSSDLLSTSQYENATVLPEFADISLTSYGISLNAIKLDYRLNPRKGYTSLISFKVGNKKIDPNPKINESLYDSLELETVQYNGTADLNWFIPLPGNFVFHTGVLAGSIVNENLFANELFRIGGLKTLRGFDEESILASTYGILTLEGRYKLEQNSYLFIFYNSAWYERNYQGEYVNDTPYGFGAGITFETKLGIFSLNYALGREFSNSLQFRAAKVHFGLVNYF